MTDTALAGNRLFDDAETLAHGVAEWLCGLAQASNRAFAISLSGGSTPRRLYECLAAPPIAARFPWSNVHWFWGDERFVPHDHPDSNYLMARDALLSRVPVPKDNIHAVSDRGLVAGAIRGGVRDNTQAILRRRPTRIRSAAVRCHAARNRGRRAHCVIVPWSGGAAGDATVGGCGHRRKIRAAHHADLSGAR